MMKSTLICVLVFVAFAAARPQSTYTDRYDNINLDEIVGNRRLLLPYVKCLLDEGKCSPDGKELKNNIQEALERNCEKCTDAQRKGTDLVIGHLINHEPELWEDLVNKYDKERVYVVRYEQKLKEIKGDA